MNWGSPLGTPQLLLQRCLEDAPPAASDEAAPEGGQPAAGAPRLRAAGGRWAAPLAEDALEGRPSRSGRRVKSEGVESCILAAVEASSTDNYPLEGIEKTLEPQARWPDPFTPSYWSSKGHQDPAVPEALVYRLRTPLCLVTTQHQARKRATGFWKHFAGSPLA